MTAKSSLSSLDRGLRILSFVQDRGPVTVAEIVNAVGIPLSSAYRYTTALAAQGYVVDMDGQLVASARLAESTPHASMRLPHVSAHVLDGLAGSTGLSVALTTRVHTVALCLAARRVNHALLAHRAGQALALHAGASATPLLAYAPQDVQDRVLTSKLISFTSATPTREELADILPTVRERGHHVTHGWLTPGMTAVGVPVIIDGTCVGALSLVGRDQETRDEALLIARLETAALSIARLAETPSSTFAPTTHHLTDVPVTLKETS